MNRIGGSKPKYLVQYALADRFKLSNSKRTKLTLSDIEQIMLCKSDLARRIILGVKHGNDAKSS